MSSCFRDVSDQVSDLQAVFERVRAAGLKLKPSKCAFFRSEVLYLGDVNAAGVAPDPAKLRVLSNACSDNCARCSVIPRVC